MVAHHDSVLEEQEVGTAAELLNLRQWTGWCRLRPYRNKFRELKVIFTDVVDVLAIIARLSKGTKRQLIEC